MHSKTRGLGFTPLHACMAGLAAKTKRLDISVPCTPCTTEDNTRSGGKPVPPRGRSLYERLARQNERQHLGNGSFRGSGDHLAVCRPLLSATADPEAMDARCRTPLAMASAAGNLEAVKVLLEAGADPRVADADGNTPAHFGFAYVNVAVVALLSERGADLDALNSESKMPQDVAGFCGRVAPLGSGSEIEEREGQMGVKPTWKT